MKEAFEVLRQFFVGASYGVFTVGCALSYIKGEFSYFSFFGAFILAILLLTLSWVAAMAARE
jgi:hypothetical protein